MSRPSWHKLGRFTLFSVLYGVAASFVVLFVAIRTCSMQPDYAETCDPTSINTTVFLIGVAYITFAAAFFRTELSGKN